MGRSLLSYSLLFSLALAGTGQNLPWADLVERAITNHPAVKAAERNYRAERLKIWSASSPADPMVMVEWMNLPVSGSTAMRETQYSVTENFPFPVRLGLAGARQAQQAEAVRWTFELRRALVRRDTVRTLLALAYQDRSLAIARDELAQYGLIEAVVNSRYGVGKASQSEWGRVKLMVAMAKAELAMREGEREEYLAALERLLPNDASLSNQMFRFEVSALSEIPPLQALLPKAQANFPELRMQQAMEARMKSEERLMNWEWAPDLSFKATLTQSESGTSSANIGAGFSLPLWFAFRQIPNVRVAKAMREAETARTADTKAMLSEGVKMRYAAFRAANRALSVLESSAAPQAAQIFEVALKEYQVDRIGFTELLEALKSVLDTANEIARSRRQLGEAAVDLHFYSGMRLLSDLP
jgi:cobalt-zinc-cadmium efflux system outer membrane protein